MTGKTYAIKLNSEDPLNKKLEDALEQSGKSANQYLKELLTQHLDTQAKPEDASKPKLVGIEQDYANLPECKDRFFINETAYCAYHVPKKLPQKILGPPHCECCTRKRYDIPKAPQEEPIQQKKAREIREAYRGTTRGTKTSDYYPTSNSPYIIGSGYQFPKYDQKDKPRSGW
jgi:hypothetical protein